MANQIIPTVIIPIADLPPGNPVLGSNIYPAVDITDLTQSPQGTTKKYSISQLLSYVFTFFGIDVYQDCLASPTSNLNATYNNGISGVGATLTNAGSFAPFTADGQAGVLNGRYLIQNQSNAAQNGIYILTTVGDSISINWVLTRAVDFNSSSNIILDSIVYVDFGSTYQNTYWQLTYTPPVVVGTTNLFWLEFTGSIAVAAKANAVLTNNTTANQIFYPTFVDSTSGYNPIYTSSANYTFNPSSGTLTAAIYNGTWQGNPVGVQYGGTGSATFTPYSIICGGTTTTGALQSVVSVGTNGQVLKSNGPGALPSWENVPGTGTVNSGTMGQVAYYAATGAAVSGESLSALIDSSIGSTQGDILYRDAAVWNVLAPGTSGQALITQGAAANPKWNGTSAGRASLNATNILVQRVNTQTGAVATGTTVIPQDDTIPQNNEGDQYMSLAITPLSASNTLEIEVVWQGSSTGSNYFVATLFQDSTANALAVGLQENFASSAGISITFIYTMTAGTTSATTFKVRAGSAGAGTTTFNGNGTRLYGGVMASSITIREYAN